MNINCTPEQLHDWLQALAMGAEAINDLAKDDVKVGTNGVIKRWLEQQAVDLADIREELVRAHNALTA